MALPGYGQIIGYGLAVILGLIGTAVFGRWLAGWENEANEGNLQNQVQANQETADKSDEDLNKQTGNLPKQ